MVVEALITPSISQDDDSSKRRQIMDGAHRVFMEQGFDGASMNEIARAAGVSKGTLYVYFPDKSRLFEAIVEHDVLELGKLAFNFDPTAPAEETLRDFGRAYVELLCRPGGDSSVRTVMGIAERMPEIGKRFYQNVIEHTFNRFAEYLQARVKAGELAIDDCSLASPQFLMMCQATIFQPYIFQAKPAPSKAYIERVVESATKIFLNTYRAKNSADQFARVLPF